MYDANVRIAMCVKCAGSMVHYYYTLRRFVLCRIKVYITFIEIQRNSIVLKPNVRLVNYLTQFMLISGFLKKTFVVQMVCSISKTVNVISI